MDEYFKSFRTPEQRTKETPHWSFEDFTDFLFSPENDIADPERTNNVHQNMDLPLSQYFINSSHNTYLTGKI